jgi:hypothetical protein
MKDRLEDRCEVALRRRHWLNAFVLAALGWAAADMAATTLALEGNWLLAGGLELGAALIVLRAGYLLFAPGGWRIRQRITARHGRL